MKVFLIILLLAAPAYADQWSEQSKFFFLTSNILWATDCLTTNQNIQAGGQEYNPLFGNHPSTGKILGIYVGGAILTYLVAEMLPDKWRAPFLSYSTGIHLSLSITNRIK